MSNLTIADQKIVGDVQAAYKLPPYCRPGSTSAGSEVRVHPVGDVSSGSRKALTPELGSQGAERAARACVYSELRVAMPVISEASSAKR
jgi:hypothetical protein